MQNKLNGGGGGKKKKYYKQGREKITKKFTQR